MCIRDRFKDDKVQLMAYEDMKGIGTNSFVRNTKKRMKIPVGEFLRGRIIAVSYTHLADLLKASGKAESGFNTSVVSSAGAIGVMQLMPATAQSLGVRDPYNACLLYTSRCV